jgi:DNA polymerase
MSDEVDRLARAAEQLVAIEELFGGQDIPLRRNPLPEIEPARAASPSPAMTPRRKAEALQALAEEVRTCARCALSQGRTNAVFGEGSADADMVFVGEAPGYEEDRTGRPFVGRAGELLTKMIHAMGLRRRDVFICNILKCRPPANRSPMPDEVACCWDFLVRQLQIIRPKVIVALGNPATKALLDTTTGITRLRGQWQKLGNIGEGLEGTPVMPTFHPAYILRRYTPDTRAKVWSDLQAVMALLGLRPASNG